MPSLVRRLRVSRLAGCCARTYNIVSTSQRLAYAAIRTRALTSWLKEYSGWQEKQHGHTGLYGFDSQAVE